MKEVFSNPNFRKLFLSNLFSGFGQGMSMIGISWYLVDTTGSAQLLGSTMFISAILMFFVGPFVGTVIDRFSHKKILLLMNTGAFLVIGLLAVWGFFGSYTEGMLIAIFFATTLVYQIHYPTQSALVQENFDEKQYKHINSLLEIEGQTASMLAGAAAGLALKWFGLHVVLLYDALSYLLAFLLLYRIEYTFTLEKLVETSPRTGWMGQLRQSLTYVKERRGLFLFGISALMPFIAVMAGNLLAPVFVSRDLAVDVKFYSLHEMTYAIGAVAAGFLIAAVTRRWGDTAALVGSILLFALTMIAIVVIPNGWVFVALSTLMGWSNASARLIRQTLLMVIVPRQFMGRLLSFFQALGMIFRLLLLGLFTLMIDITGAGIGYLILAGLLLLATLGVYVSMGILLRPSAGSQAFPAEIGALPSATAAAAVATGTTATATANAAILPTCTPAASERTASDK
ncbi:MFS transporter [Brevibacillus humidisoli]|uniref:MFS transporter n=1 Tax=Brevibacillus humidisoli TaxID=2895522 RepID=UPI001E2C9FAC|nr:MFS transporter [Brevibacillus humidisoli]UFJ40218.1 MFS transporter [Brevibacillus humidisoli]